MKGTILSVAIGVVGILAVVVGAQSEAGRMPRHDGMDMAKDVTYTGCLEAGTTGAGTFALTHPAMIDPHHQEMKMKDSGKMNAMAGQDMSEHGMMPMMLTSASGAVDLRKHVGHKVSVSGSVTQGMMAASGADTSTLTVKSLKMLSKSCM